MLLPFRCSRNSPKRGRNVPPVSIPKRLPLFFRSKKKNLSIFLFCIFFVETDKKVKQIFSPQREEDMIIVSGSWIVFFGKLFLRFLLRTFFIRFNIVDIRKVPERSFWGFVKIAYACLGYLSWFEFEILDSYPKVDCFSFIVLGFARKLFQYFSCLLFPFVLISGFLKSSALDFWVSNHSFYRLIKLSSPPLK